MAPGATILFFLCDQSIIYSLISWAGFITIAEGLANTLRNHQFTLLTLLTLSRVNRMVAHNSCLLRLALLFPAVKTDRSHCQSGSYLQPQTQAIIKFINCTATAPARGHAHNLILFIKSLLKRLQELIIISCPRSCILLQQSINHLIFIFHIGKFWCLSLTVRICGEAIAKSTPRSFKALAQSRTLHAQNISSFITTVSVVIKSLHRICQILGQLLQAKL